MEGTTAVPLEYERLVQKTYEALLRPGDVALDVGAHVGRHTLPMARCVGPAGRVLAFEPLPTQRAALVAELNRDASLAGRVEVSGRALGAAVGPAEFVVAVDLPSYSGLRERTYDAPTRLERVAVDVRTLDEISANRDALRLIKIDAEGGELDILRGGRATLRRLRPVVVFEFGLRALGNYDATPAELFDLLAGAGYRLYAIDGRRLDEAAFVASSTLQVIHDYVAVPSEDAESCATIEATLNERAMALLRLRAVLGEASHAVARVGQVPALAQLPAWLRSVGRWVAGCVLFASRPFTARQRRANAALLEALERTIETLEQPAFAGRGLAPGSAEGRRDAA